MHKATRRATSRIRKQRPRFFTPLRFETLEDRTLLAEVSVASSSPAWHNVFDPLDVNADSFVAPNDVVQIINYVNANGAGAVPPGANNGPPFYDTNGDAFVGAADALAAINALNAFGANAARLPPEARDFAFVAVNGAQRTQTLVINNTGTTPIHLSPLQISGPGAADYSLIQAPSSVIAAGSTTSFTLKFDPSATGARPATVSIPNDSVLSNYNIAINGAGVDVQGLAAAAPGSIEAVTVQGLSLDGTVSASVVLTDSSGQESELAPIPVTRSGASSSFTFAVPLHIDPSTFVAAAGTVNVRLEQRITSGTTRVELGSLAIADLPQTGVAVGTVFSAFIAEWEAFLDSTIADYQQLAPAASGIVDLTSVVSGLQSLRQQCSSIQQQLTPLINGQVSRVDLANNVFLDSAALSTVDREIASWVLNSFPQQAGLAAGILSVDFSAPTVLTAAAIDWGARLHSLFNSFVTSLSAGFDGALPLLKNTRDRLAAGAALAATVAAIEGGPSAILAGAATGTTVLLVSDAAILAVGIPIKLLASMVKNGGPSVTFNDVKGLCGFMADVVYDKAIDGVGENVAHKLLPPPSAALGGAYSLVSTVLQGLTAGIFEVEPSPGQPTICDAIHDNFSKIEEIVFKPDVSIGADVMLNEGNSGNTQFPFVVTLSKPVHYQSVIVDISTAVRVGTATGGEDYISIGSQQLLFGPDETSKTIPVFVRGDFKHESNEIFFVELISAKFVETGQSLAITRGEAIGTIVNDDTAGVDIRESGGSTNVAEGGVTDTYTIALTSQPTALVMITLHPNNQVQVSPTTMTFDANNWNVPQTATVTAIDDSVVEGSHTGTITHSVASNDSDYSGLAIRNVIANITDNDSSPTVLGTWSGPYTFTVPAGPCITHNQGTARITFTSLDNNGNLSGTSFVDGVDDLNFLTCAHVDYSTASGSASGKLVPDVTMDEIMNGLLDMTNDRFGGNVEIEFTATITGNTMTGKLFDANGVQRGSFTLTKQ
jgi:hypothetical protein